MVSQAINHQEVFVKVIEKETYIEITHIKRVEAAKKTRQDIVITNTLLISYYLYLYISIHRTLITNQTINQIAKSSQRTSQIANMS